MKSKRALSLGLVLAVVLSPAASIAESSIFNKKIKVKRRGTVSIGSDYQNRVDERVDDARDARKEAREDWQQHWNEDEERWERERIQQLRVGTNGKSCIYGVNDEILHQPEGVVCDSKAPGPKPPAKATR